MSKKDRREQGCATALLSRFCGTVLTAGLVILLIGAYYALVRAGIPYQDPTAEMQLRYAINAGIGRTLLIVGGAMTAAGGVARLLLWRSSKKE